MNDAQYVAMMRMDLYAFTRLVFSILEPRRRWRAAPHVAAMCHALMKTSDPAHRNLVISAPPRHLKSITVAVAYVAWMLGNNPSLKILVATYNSDLGAKHGRDFRKVIESPRFQRIFPNFAIDPARNSAEEMLTTEGGGRKSVTVGGPVTGFGAHITIIDDLMKSGEVRSPAAVAAAKAYVDETLFSRFDDHATGVTIAIHQRMHEDDVTGHLLATGEFEHLNLPAIAQDHQRFPMTPRGTFVRAPGDILAPEIVSAEQYKRIERRVGPATFAAQYLQTPTAPGGNRIRWSFFKEHDRQPSRAECLYVIQTVDTAHSGEPESDYCVWLTLGFHENDWKILDNFRRKLDYADQQIQAERLYRLWQPDVIIVEKAATGHALAQFLKKDSKCLARVIAQPITKDKETRVEIQTAKLRDGTVSVWRDAPWRPEFKSETMGFPNSMYDDQVDALMLFLEFLDRREWRTLEWTNPETGRRYANRRNPVRRASLRATLARRSA